ncbi:MAG: cell surface protein SprA [Sphingobacteriales bacterium JAD_PAG50586_3]|nr:MAG: cell surface protein SprA [Sphingobacteriales bacterium JAD_PAG50586_3]
MVKAVLCLKTVSFTYTTNEGTALPGYLPKSDLFGNDLNYGDPFSTPGLPFVFGSQRDIRPDAIQGGWITQDTILNTQLGKTKGNSLNLNATIEPYKDLRITLSATRSYNENYTSVFRYDNITQSYQDFNAMTTGNFSISTITWRTAFKGFDKDNNYASETFDKFLNMRNEMAFRQAGLNPNWSGQVNNDPLSPNFGFPEGYGKTSQEVLVPSFIAAYSGRTAKAQSLNPFPAIPLPNWRVTYDGLAKIPALKKIFKNLTVSHSYRSSYNVGSFVSDLKFGENNGGASTFNNDGDFISRYALSGGVSISEQFGPLIGFDMTLQNSLLARFEIKKTRTLNLSINNNQLNEITNDEIVIGTGYVIKNVTLPLKIG